MASSSMESDVFAITRAFTALFMVAILGGGLALAGEMWETSASRSLEDLLKDPRRPGTERYLRRLYADPMTGKDRGNAGADNQAAVKDRRKMIKKSTGKP